jgi:Flp pilus assembly protein TadD
MATLSPATTMAAHGDVKAARVLMEDYTVKLKSVIELQPDNARLWSRLAQMEALLGQKEAALRDARKAVEIRPESVDAAYGPEFSRTLAMVYAWTGDKERAIAELIPITRNIWTIQVSEFRLG